MSKRFLLILAVCVIGLGALFWFTKDNSSESSDSSNKQVAASEHKFGKGGSGVTFVEYGDFQCPACGGYHQIIESVKNKYKDQITFQFRHFPLSQIHQNAMAAHRAAEAAAKQNKFWEMYSLLYENQESWSSSSSPSTIFELYASRLSLDVQQYKQDVNSSEINDIINADLTEGKKLDISSTPTFFIDGKKLDEPPKDVEGFSKIIEEAINKKTTTKD